MKDVTLENEPRNPLEDALTKMLAGAIALAVRRPEVIEALRATFAQEANVEKKTGLTKVEIAKAIGKSTSTVDRLDREDGAPFTYAGDQKRYDLDAYRTWLASRGKMATRASKTDNVDVGDVATAAGLRAVSR